jgi:hypothetical protein
MLGVKEKPLDWRFLLARFCLAGVRRVPLYESRF